jgi:hypothetical protein
MKDMHRSVLIQVQAHRYNQLTLPDNKVSASAVAVTDSIVTDILECVISLMTKQTPMVKQCANLSPPFDYVS